MADLFDTQERTEDATPKRREEARERGQFARSKDLSTAVVLLVTVGVLLAYGPALVRGMASGIVLGVQRMATNAGSHAASAEILRSTLGTITRLAGPFLVFAAAAGVLLHVVQAGGFFVANEALALKFERLDPARNLARFLSFRGLATILTALLKTTVIVAVLAFALHGRLDEIAALGDMNLEAAAPKVGSLLLALFLRVTGALLVLGLGDFFYQRWQHSRDLRMSKQQVRDEHKREEGDPTIKRKVRDRLRQMIEKPLRQAVGEATVIVTNPTHFAVALEYVEGKSAAPKVVAKGVDRVAEEIKRIARDANVPVVEQPPLARALFRDVQVGNSIPEALYRAVATVLAIVWKLREEKAARERPAKARAAAAGAARSGRAAGAAGSEKKARS